MEKSNSLPPAYHERCMDDHCWGEIHFLISNQKMICQCLWSVSCSSQTVQQLWLLPSQSMPEPKGVELFPFACCNMLWFIPASYQKQGMEGAYGAHLSIRELLQRHTRQCDGQCPPEKKNCFSLLLQVWSDYQLKHKITWDYFKNSMVFKFTRLHLKFFKHAYKKEIILSWKIIIFSPQIISGYLKMKCVYGSFH